MGICRDCFGKLSYTATNSYGATYSVTCGDNTIRFHRPYISGIASIWIDSEMAFFENCPQFDSFIKAVRYMKKNLEYLL